MHGELKDPGGSSPESFFRRNASNVEQTTAKGSSQSTAVGRGFSAETRKWLGGLEYSEYNSSQRSSLGGLQSVEQCDWKLKEHVEKSVNESLSLCEYRLKGERKTKGRRG